LGRKILEGAAEVSIFGEAVPVKCKKVNIPGFSAHADQPHLLAWLASAKQSLKKVFVVQGEDASSEALAGKIRDELAVTAEVPKLGEMVEL
jgi:metallo-beta-lactamase family protein